MADGEHSLKAAKELGFTQVSVVRLPVDEGDRRMISQVMNKIRGEHDLFLYAEEYYRIASEGSRDLLKALLNESDLRIENLRQKPRRRKQTNRSRIRVFRYSEKDEVAIYRKRK